MLRAWIKKLRSRRRRHEWRQERFQPDWLNKSFFTRAHKYVCYVCENCGKKLVTNDYMKLIENEFGCPGVREDDRETTGSSRP